MCAQCNNKNLIFMPLNRLVRQRQRFKLNMQVWILVVRAPLLAAVQSLMLVHQSLNREMILAVMAGNPLLM